PSVGLCISTLSNSPRQQRERPDPGARVEYSPGSIGEPVRLPEGISAAGWDFDWDQSPLHDVLLDDLSATSARIIDSPDHLPRLDHELECLETWRPRPSIGLRLVLDQRVRSSPGLLVATSIDVSAEGVDTTL